MSNTLLDGLNEEQRDCVQHEAPVLQILAGPGSGKTRVLTARVALMVTIRHIAPEQIIVVTFTNKAAQELKHRLTMLIGENATRKLIVGTFHAVALRFLQRYGTAIGLPQRIMVADAAESRNVVAKVLKKLKKDNAGSDDQMSPGSAMSHISKLKCLGIQPEDVMLFIKSRDSPIKLAPSLGETLVRVFEAYQEHLAKHNLLDFDDLIIQCIRLLRELPRVVAAIESVFVDEFQDTSSHQFDLMTLFAQHRQHLTVVGDHDQSIYGFRAADIRNFKRMHSLYHCTEVYLQSNYRSSGSIVFAAAALIEQDSERPAKQLNARHGIGPQPCLRVLKTAATEAEWIATECRRLLNDTAGLVVEADIAILVRAASLTLPVEQALQRKRIPYKLANARKFLERPHIKVLVAYLRVVQDPNSPALLEVINVPSRKFGAKSIEQWQARASQQHLPMWWILELAYQGRLCLSDRADGTLRQRLSSFMSTINKARKAMTEDAEHSIVLLLESIIVGIGYEAYIKETYPDDYADRLADVSEFTQTARILGQAFDDEESLPPLEDQDSHQLTALDRLLAALSLMSDAGAGDESEKQTVTISTIHSAKGLEWSTVFIPGVYHGSIPSSRAEDAEQDEERRLLYVAMTRAKALLYLSYPLKSARFEAVTLSGFLAAPVMQPFFTERGPRLTTASLGELATILGKAAPEGPCRISEDVYVEPRYKQPGEGDGLVCDNPDFQRQAVTAAESLPGFGTASTVFRRASAEELNRQKPTVDKPEAAKIASKVRPTSGNIASFFVRPVPRATPLQSRTPAEQKRTFEDHTVILLSSSPERVIYHRAKRRAVVSALPEPQCLAPPPAYSAEDIHVKLQSSPPQNPQRCPNEVIPNFKQEQPIPMIAAVVPTTRKRLGMARPRLLPRG